jgi:hypothetical protein
MGEYDVMGAIGAAMLAREHAGRNEGRTRFKGFESSRLEYRAPAFECKSCSNHCEIMGIKFNTAARGKSSLALVRRALVPEVDPLVTKCRKQYKRVFCPP